VVSLEDLGALFSMRSTDILAAVARLEAHNLLSGVMDDRGKVWLERRHSFVCRELYLRRCGQ
jgi:hypothetical protein